ncbi:MAG: hypothetical protein KIS66_14200 [Fimbriimonadaceae bacterium]|nr:hypothetical protein [Fimbriimonadaceae bacterium]
MKISRGGTLVELLVAAVISLLIGGVALYAYTDSNTMRDVAGRQNQTYAVARQTLDTIADHIRSAQVNAAASNRVIKAADGSSITYYADPGDGILVAVKYFRDGNTLKRSDPSGVSVVLLGISSLEFTYYKAATYTSATWSPTTNPSVPAIDELPSLVAVKIRVVTNVSGSSRALETVVRFRNSPAS